MNLCSGEDLKWRWIFLARDIEVEGHQYSLQNDLQLKKKINVELGGYISIHSHRLN